MPNPAEARGRLSISLRVGDTATVETPDGEIEVQCVRHNGDQQLSLRIIAPKHFNIRRETVGAAG